MALVYGQDERVTRWVAQQCGEDCPPPAYASIGYERNGDLVAGVFFDGRTETNLFAHIASSSSLIPSAFLYAVARFAYGHLGVRRMTFMVKDDNLACVRMVMSMGAYREAVLVQGHAKGDTLLFALWDDCDLYRRLCEKFDAKHELVTE